MRRNLAEETGWGSPVVRAVCVVPICTAIVAVAQHGFTVRAVALGVLLPWWVSAAVEIVCTAVLVSDPAGYDVAPLLLVVLIGVFAATESAKVSLATLAAASLMMVGLELADRFVGSAIWLLGMSFGWVGGFAIRLQDEAHAVRQERATEDERARIGRELHDVVAHSLAVTMLNLTAARLALHRDSDEAEVALRQAEESGRQTMADIRRVVGRLDDRSGSAAPAPGAADIPELVRGFAEAGLHVSLEIDGDVDGVPPVAGLAAYRIVQESITNVVKHAPGSGVAVEVVIERDVLHVSIRNPVTVPSRAMGEGGSGIVGMTERAALVGGTLRAGPRDDTWCVAADLPVRSP